MNLLLHSCCGPCTIYPLSVIQKQGIDVSCYFYNPNIHPYKEFKKRIEALSMVSKHFNCKVVFEKTYELIGFLRNIVFHEKDRCMICYELRLNKTVEFALKNGFDAFSTTLLYSRYQNHEALIEKCLHLAEHSGLDFFYKDFREGWQSGIDRAKALNIYRQSYCGCIYSEQESFDKKYRLTLFKQKSLPSSRTT